MRRRHRSDGNQAEILSVPVTVKRRCPGCGVRLPHNPRVRTCGAKACRRVWMEQSRGAKPVTKCEGCGTEFEHFPSQKRKFCSYKCHLESGGALRAGAAASRARVRYGAKKDANHKELVDALGQMGVQVLDMSGVGGGFPDLICCVRRETILVEIKNRGTAYGRRGLNKLQRAFADGWRGGPIYIIENLRDAENLASRRLSKLDSYGGGGGQ